jgi:hypothetical protein
LCAVAIISHPRFLEVLPELAIDQADCWEVLHADEAEFLQLFEECGHSAEGVDTPDACEDRCVFDDREDFAGLVELA